MLLQKLKQYQENYKKFKEDQAELNELLNTFKQSLRSKAVGAGFKLLRVDLYGTDLVLQNGGIDITIGTTLEMRGKGSRVRSWYVAYTASILQLIDTEQHEQLAKKVLEHWEKEKAKVFPPVYTADEAKAMQEEKDRKVYDKLKKRFG